MWANPRRGFVEVQDMHSRSFRPMELHVRWMNKLRVYYRRLFYRFQCRGSCLAWPVFVSRARILVGTCLIIELSELTKKLLFLMLSFFVSSQRNVQLHFLGSIRRPCLRAQHPLVFHGELSLPRGLKGGKASYNDQHGHISNTSVICWILGSPQRVNFFFQRQRKSISEFPGLSLSLWYTEPICIQKLCPEGIFSR